MTIHQVSRGTVSNPIMIPHPDLLGLVKRYLPGEAGIAVMYSITGGLSFRIARLAGMLANKLASDIRLDPEHYSGAEAWARNSLSSYNDAMSFIDQTATSDQWFDDAGGQRSDMHTDLSKLLHFKRTCDDYMVTLLGESKMRPNNWLDTIDMASQPMPVDQWKLDHLWADYIEQTDGQPLMSRKEYDVLNVRELSGQHAAWSKHANAVLNLIEHADKADAIEFDKLDVRTQLALLMSYATPERLAKFRASIMKRARSAFDFDSTLRLHKAFVEACRLATTHHRFAKEGDAIVARREPVVSTPKDIAAATRARAVPHAELIAESVNAEQRAAIANKIAVKRDRKPKAVKQEDLRKELALADQPNDL